ncbi:Dyp-type peroxidase [Sinomonas sp. JGH33]|uniref:Dyp-type peroxidase n=1 Tax=Sinomonas terricola TaxID=3110330 RepID=A0ABU5T3I8_9MICC|nr:Dyp-type peroxidase [Sinomonas sp. JGH33]MEA5454225.1 Dyp-type peroxidase [Sinomonas sp. JGH33]
MQIQRRSFLIGAGGAAAGGLLSATAARAETTPSAPAESSDVVDFLGANQAGVYRPASQQQHACFAAFKVLCRDAAELKALLQRLTVKAAILGGGHEESAALPSVELSGVDGAPPVNSGVMGEDVPAANFTMTLGLAGSLFDNPALGLAAKKPKGLTDMKVFPKDQIDQEWTGGDLILQLCAGSSDMVHYALRDIMKATRGQLQLEWKINGFHNRPRPDGAPRNLFGYKDGIVNPAQDEKLVWIGKDSGQPVWAEGGTFMVVRSIRMLVEFWDRVGLGEQDGMIGRHRASGAPLGQDKETDTPDYAADPKGETIPLDAHIRLANPRTKETAGSRMLRRGYNYELGVDLNGNLQAGLIFTSFQQSIQEQFEATQTRLADEPMTDYIEPFGGGYFFVVPGVRDEGGFLGEGLFA